MSFKKELIDRIKNLKIFSKNKKKFLGFMIGNTSKVEKKGFYFYTIKRDEFHDTCRNNCLFRKICKNCS